MRRLVVRRGKADDFEAVLEAEKAAWKDSGVPLITEAQFTSWLRIFPEGLLLAEHGGEVCGHLFSQICDFDPTDEWDRRNWEELTDHGFCQATHNPAAQTMYTVSVSATRPGAGKLLLRTALVQMREIGLRYYVGASSIPGLSGYAAQTGRRPDRQVAEEYVAAILRKLGYRTDDGPRLTDPVVSVTLSVEGARFYRLLADYFHYPASGNWAVLIAYENPNWQGGEVP